MEELVDSILDYVRADYTDYAIMLNGEWGSDGVHHQRRLLCYAEREVCGRNLRRFPPCLYRRFCLPQETLGGRAFGDSSNAGCF